MIIKEYINGDKLEENQYLLKIRPVLPFRKCQLETGFLVKFNKDGSVPAAFKSWGDVPTRILPIFIFEEDFRSGWEIVDYRSGSSQNWAIMKHPEGFTLEIKLSEFFDILKTNKVNNGVLEGEFKWFNTSLIKKNI
jgi:hypothetical protein